MQHIIINLHISTHPEKRKSQEEVNKHTNSLKLIINVKENTLVCVSSTVKTVTTLLRF